MNTLKEFLQKGKTQFHVVNNTKEYLVKNNFTELSMYDEWQLKAGGKYFVTPFSSMLVAFVVGSYPKNLRIAAAHSDFPMLKLKSSPAISKNGYLLANIEPYGGLITTTWFDRPLGLAGKIVSKGENAFSPKVTLFDSGKPIFIIPNLAPHLKKDSKNGDIDLQKELMPIGAMADEFKDCHGDYIINYLASESGLEAADILDYDLYFYIFDQPIELGINESFLASPRIDNVSSATAILESLCSSNIENNICVYALFDNEEIGSRSKQGADSIVLKEILDKIISDRSMYKNAFYLSVDVAHGTHPNYAEKNDITNPITLGKGFALKTSASQRYVSDSEAGAVINSLCQTNGINFQKQVNRTGMPGGQTLGPIISSYIPVKAVDLGIPVLAMHSACELMHTNDYLELKKLIKAYYECN